MKGEKEMRSRPSIYLKMRVLGAIDYASGKSRAERIKKVSNMHFTDESGKFHQFTWRTIQTWYSRYNKDGITSMKPKQRSDKGKNRKINAEEVSEAIEHALPYFKKGCVNKMQIYRLCIERGFLRREQIAYNTFCRFIKQYDFLKPGEVNNKMRLAFSKEHANELWQGDTMDGPYVRNGNQKSKTKLIAFIDDASRVVAHGEFFLSENTDTLIEILKTAFYKRGIPDSMYVDNGSIYSCKEIILVCARIGTILRHAPVGDGAAKGKIERFFKTVRSSFLCRNLDLSSLKKLNQQFHVWLEEGYNAKEHSSIHMKPIDRFNLDLKRVRFLPPNESSDELFFFEEDRQVKKDNTFSLKNSRYEAPRDFRSRKIQVRFNRYNLSKVIVYYKGERMGDARKLNPVLNDRYNKESRR